MVGIKGSCWLAMVPETRLNTSRNELRPTFATLLFVHCPIDSWSFINIIQLDTHPLIVGNLKEFTIAYISVDQKNVTFSVWLREGWRDFHWPKWGYASGCVLRNLNGKCCGGEANNCNRNWELELRIGSLWWLCTVCLFSYALHLMRQSCIRVWHFNQTKLMM